MHSRFFALVIGIDKYPGLKRNNQDHDLGGACSDARNIRKWLIEYVVGEESKDNITLLLDEQATREEIIKKITALSTYVQPRDPILIYYAGHGGVAMTHPRWNHVAKGGNSQSGDSTRIEVLLPHDVYTPREAPMDQQIQPIPDTTINCLLRELAQKSDNIVRSTPRTGFCHMLDLRHRQLSLIAAIQQG